MSERVMTLIGSMVPATEVYSIDECFAHLSGMPGRLTQFGLQVRSRIFQCTGIPVGVGIAPTKTLAKLANHTAKRLQAQTGGVVDICDPFKRDWVLRNTETPSQVGIEWIRTEDLWCSVEPDHRLSGSPKNICIRDRNQRSAGSLSCAPRHAMCSSKLRTSSGRSSARKPPAAVSASAV